MGASQVSPTTVPVIPGVLGYCNGCSVTHLVKDYPKRPKDSNKMGRKTMLNIVGVIPSPQTSETETEMGNVPLRVVTRAQAREAGREDERIRESPRHAKDTTPEKSEKNKGEEDLGAKRQIVRN